MKEKERRGWVRASYKWVIFKTGRRQKRLCRCYDTQNIPPLYLDSLVGIDVSVRLKSVRSGNCRTENTNNYRERRRQQSTVRRKPNEESRLETDSSVDKTGTEVELESSKKVGEPKSKSFLNVNHGRIKTAGRR